MIIGSPFKKVSLEDANFISMVLSPASAEDIARLLKRTQRA
jgi:hypothetical protein